MQKNKIVMKKIMVSIMLSLFIFIPTFFSVSCTNISSKKISIDVTDIIDDSKRFFGTGYTLYKYVYGGFTDEHSDVKQNGHQRENWTGYNEYNNINIEIKSLDGNVVSMYLDGKDDQNEIMNLIQNGLLYGITSETFIQYGYEKSDFKIDDFIFPVQYLVQLFGFTREQLIFIGYSEDELTGISF